MYAKRLKSERADSSCRDSKAQPVFSALKYSSIVQRARYPSTTAWISEDVEIASLVRRIHSTGGFPSGGAISKTWTMFTTSVAGRVWSHRAGRFTTTERAANDRSAILLLRVG